MYGNVWEYAGMYGNVRPSGRFTVRPSVQALGTANGLAASLDANVGGAAARLESQARDQPHAKPFEP